MSDLPDPLGVALRVTGTLDALGVTHTIGGSIASSIAGEPRSTIDEDIVADLRADQVSAFARRLEGDFYLDEAAMTRAVANASSFNLIHHESSIKVDVFIAGGTPLDRQQLARRREVVVGGRTLYVHPPEDILLQKMRWYRMSGDSSERQWRDILAIVRVQGHRLDREYVRRHAGTLGVADLAERLLGG